MTSELILVTATSVIGLIVAQRLIENPSESAPEAEVVPIPVRTDETDSAMR
ncbi:MULTISPECIES: hypothetical protein [Roseofilum]|uniref:hypothetical protein n=1 Tax=Roseofilum TaxID=1233426 RepID=UPI000AEF4FAF|nr:MULTISPECIES: hypothetical protein [Roseofilum]MBP0010317.1 hypothetical protein [Roseofilum sp. Belize Diploria]MBP0012631.1 hypothetical protein [Roseofilum sp. SID3]MBP0023135.1 hypothetical protein [Roseofilum sp. SID2]MBP0029310.1 hypothetical protein [Roseofilum sp. Guam]MBP0033395.1 hypothetical protein [Roseofilum sp. Belize BBD 4]